MSLKNKLTEKKGFTLVELLLVILIIVIIGLILIPNIIESLNSSRVENAKSIEKLLIKNLELYNSDHEKDLWVNSNNNYGCVNDITITDLMDMNPDIKLGECLLNPENADGFNLTIEKVGSKQYKYYVGITCGKKLTPKGVDGENRYIYGRGEEIYYTTKNHSCDTPFTLVADPNKGTILDTNGWELVNGKAQKQVRPGDKYGDLPVLNSREGYAFIEWNTDKSGNGDTVDSTKSVMLDVQTIYAKWRNTTEYGNLMFSDQNIKLGYQETPQQFTIPEPATNGIGEIVYTIDSQTSGGSSVDYFSISGTQIYVQGRTPVGTYTVKVKATDNNDNARTAIANYTVTIERRIETIVIPETPLNLPTYNGSLQLIKNFGLECPNHTEETSNSKSSAKDVGTYYLECRLKDTTNYKWGDETTTDKRIRWEIKPATCPKPTNITVSASGIVGWRSTESSATYQMKIDDGEWSTAVSGRSYLDDIISKSGERTISLKTICDAQNYTGPSEVATQTVNVNEINFKSSNTDRGTVDTSKYNVISGATLTADNDKLLIKESDTATEVLKTIKATPNTGHSFDKWSKTSGELSSGDEITADFTVNQYTVEINILEGTVDESRKTVNYNESPTFTVTPTEAGATAKASCTNDQTATVNGSTLTVNNVSNNTVCTVTFTTDVTVLYSDGTLIINEKVIDRNTNMSTHGTVVKEYNKLSDRYVYNFSSAADQLWINESLNIKKVQLGQTINPTNTAHWFEGLMNMESANLTNMNTADVTAMNSMFSQAGYNSNVTNFTLTGLNNWNVSNVTNMSSMFSQVGYSASTFNIGTLETWDTSNVTNMASMFSQAGSNATTFNIDLTNWNTSKVKNMSSMFANAGYGASQNAASWSIGDLSTKTVEGSTRWDVSKVEQIDSMFYNAGYSAKTFNIGNIGSWSFSSISDSYTASSDPDTITGLAQMFANAGYNATTWYIGELNNWNVSNVKNMLKMFAGAGYHASSFDIGDLSNWTVTNVINMNSVFQETGYNSNAFNIGKLNNWNVSNAIYMNSMFANAGYKASTFELDLSSWRPIKASDMGLMFMSSGHDASTWTIGNLKDWRTPAARKMTSMFNAAGHSTDQWSIGDLKDWNVSSATNMAGMFSQAAYSSTSFDLGNLSNWNVSNVQNMSSMFAETGRSATTWNIGDIGSWNVSNVTNMNAMFFIAGAYNSDVSSVDNWSPGTLTDWNTSKVTDMSYMFYSSGFKARNWSIGNISGWDTSKVTTMSNMFYGAGNNATTFNIGTLTSWNTSKVTDMYRMFFNTATNANIWDMGTLNISATNIQEIFASTPTVKAILKIHSNPTQYANAFNNTATATGSHITVDYSSTTTNIANIIATRTSNNVEQGSQID